ncbi:hypothetical protein [Streptomyces sp. VRA16 Mangrove soil]|uniref:hypothetical protein n=1 Tax=Streptomyces sp. VRA16 Mangrove soil TaxID=2817434 RepID=UPI001A9F5B48|nr:hypothetical protein [Streptomyces sp. VRA16 Mangrove soil]MBO1330727.1 hypothetical protein [Streptomyces sp. VRA16 Mangrove soil]
MNRETVEELFVVEGYREIRGLAADALAVDGPDPVVYLWLGLGHMAEDEDDHDAEAEKAFLRGLELAPDDVDLLAAYAELCLRADEWEYPRRARRAPELVARLEELAAGSPQDEHIREVLAWHRRGYLEDFRLAVVDGRARRAQLEQQSGDLDRALTAQRGHGDAGVGVDATVADSWLRAAGIAEEQRAAILAATLEELSGRAYAPLRFVARNRSGAYVVAAGLAFVTNFMLRTLDVVQGITFWGFLWFVPLLILDRRLASARERARQTVIARIMAQGATESG